jgi:hypothetical protein
MGADIRFEPEGLRCILRLPLLPRPSPNLGRAAGAVLACGGNDPLTSGWIAQTEYDSHW